MVGWRTELIAMRDGFDLRDHSGMPAAGVYLVKPAASAWMQASLICCGVSKSGSPAPKSTTSTPCARNFSASAATFMVDETLINEMRSAISVFSSSAMISYFTSVAGRLRRQC